MGRAADVKSVGAVRAFKNDLLEYQTALRQTLEILILEVRRGIQWLESDRKAYWPAQVRKASDAMAEARINLQQFIDDQGATFLHPYNNAQVIAGQGTAVKELMEETSSLDTVLVPIGGGGLASGTAIASKHWSPNTKVIAVEPEMADDAARSFRSGKLIPSENPQTIADGLRTSLGDITFPLIQKHVDDIITVSEKSIAETMKSIWHRMKIIVEPSAAVPLAALLSNQLDVRGQKVGIILSGGNVEI